MQNQTKLNSGIYILEIRAKEDFEILKKSFSGIILKRGFYYYTGSPQKNLSHRLERHLNKDKKLHWHIDYITSVPTNIINRIFVLPQAPRSVECKVNLKLQKHFNIAFPLDGFGNSDCRNCRSHLLFSSKKLKPEPFFYSVYKDDSKLDFVLGYNTSIK